MSIWLIITIVSIVLIIPMIIWYVKSEEEASIPLYASVVLFFIIIGCGLIAIIQPIRLKKEFIRQDKERTQIEYQIKNLDENSDKVKLNEWILTYNDWVNDVNTSKEMYGVFSRYYLVDMTNHTVIDLV